MTAFNSEWVVCVRLSGFRTPAQMDRDHCGSKSTTATFFPIKASAVARFKTVLDLPTPPFWEAQDMTLHIFYSLPFGRTFFFH
jgi:hypothetical protein